MTASAIAVILARRGSKGLPGKNIMPLAGRACIEWSIAAAQAAETVGGIVVSTDCPIAADLAKAHGCEIVARPAELASDGATVDDAARHAVMSRRPTGESLEPIVILYANVPVRPIDLIDRAVNTLIATGCDSVQSYAPVGKNHPWWLVRLGHDGAVTPWEGQILNHGVYRRQDLPPVYVPDGGVIALTRRALMLDTHAEPGPHAFLGVDRRGIISGHGAVVDIDTRADALFADAILSASVSAPISSTPLRSQSPSTPIAAGST